MTRGGDLDRLGVVISIHALREEGDPGALRRHRWKSISIHALREEGDHDRADDTVCRHKFLSTPSARRATGHLHGQAHICWISIHALCEEGDLYLRKPLEGY